MKKGTRPTSSTQSATEVDEDYIKAIMNADVPQLRIRKQIAAEHKAARENKELHEVEVTEEDMNDPEVDAEVKDLLTPPTVVEKRKPARSAPSPTLPPPEYAKIFLRRRFSEDRKQCYISRYSYNKITHYLGVLDKRISMTSYLDAIVRHHFEQFHAEINELYNQRLEEPFSKEDIEHNIKQ